MYTCTHAIAPYLEVVVRIHSHYLYVSATFDLRYCVSGCDIDFCSVKLAIDSFHADYEHEILATVYINLNSGQDVI